MKHTMVTFQLHKIGVWMLVVGAVIFSGLVFAAGYLIGSARRTPSVTMPKVAAPAIAVPQPTAPPVAATLTTQPAAAPPATPAPAEPRTFTLRVAAFATEEEAKKAVEDLALRKLQASVVVMPTSSATILYAVCVGNYPTRAEASAAAEALAKNHSVEGVVVPAT